MQIALNSDITIGGFFNPSSSLFVRGSEHGKQVAWLLDGDRKTEQRLLGSSSSLEQESFREKISQLEQQLHIEQEARLNSESRAKRSIANICEIENKLLANIEKNRHLELQHATMAKQLELAEQYVQRLRDKLIATKSLEHKVKTTEIALQTERDLRKVIEQQMEDEFV